MGFMRQTFRSWVVGSLFVFGVIWLSLLFSMRSSNEKWIPNLNGDGRMSDDHQDRRPNASGQLHATCPQSPSSNEQKLLEKIKELERERENDRKRREKERKVWDKSNAVNGAPMDSFRDNLRNDTYYLTSWSAAGYTNQLIGYVNMIYLATISDRVPIIPPFAPDHHISAAAGVLPFGDVFDLDILRAQLRIPVLEWRDIKNIPEPGDPYQYPFVPGSKQFPSEELGCWSTRPPLATQPRTADNLVHHIGVDASYVRVPFLTRYHALHDPNEYHVSFPLLTALIYRSATFSAVEKSRIATTWLPPPDPEREPHRFEEMLAGGSGHHRKPEGHLTCFDELYFAGSGAEWYEWRFGYSPVWRTVGKYLRFTTKMTDMTEEYMDALFGKLKEEDDASRPPFIAVHIRRGDFARDCAAKTCLPPLYVYEKEVEDIKEELREKRGIEAKHVVVMSDERSPAFWEDAKALGWLSIDHSASGHRTVKRFGEWYPVLVDIVVQSYAIGFVGTEDSTFSLVSQRRVEDWNGGFVRSVNPAYGDWKI